MPYHLIYDATNYGYPLSYTWIFVLILAAAAGLFRLFRSALKESDHSGIVFCLGGLVVLLTISIVLSDGIFKHYMYAKVLNTGK